MTPNDNIGVMTTNNRENNVTNRKSFSKFLKNIYNNNVNYDSRNQSNRNDPDNNYLDYDYNSNFDDEYIDGPIYANESIIQRVKRRFNLLDYDIKHLVAYAESLLCTVRNHEQTIYRMNGDLNIAQDRVYNLENRAKTAQKSSKIQAQTSPPKMPLK